MRGVNVRITLCKGVSRARGVCRIRLIFGLVCAAESICHNTSK